MVIKINYLPRRNSPMNKALLKVIRPFFTFLVLLLLGQGLYAQFQDNFDDGSFPNDPDWLGDTDIYQVNASNELQLMDVDGGTSYIYTALATGDTATWEFFFRLEFAPSTSNQLKVYLTSNSSDLEGALNGYFLQIGASGSEDALELRRQDGSSSTVLLSGQLGGVADEPAVRVRVTRSTGGEWQLFADYTGGANFQDEGSVNDNTYTSGSFFGFSCEYSSTRKDKFFFDDIFAGPIVQDETAPVLLSAEAQDANTVLLTFDEALEESVAENAANYSLDNGGMINSATLSTPTELILDVNMLISGSTYTVSADNISDLNGNVADLQEFSFSFFLLEAADEFDILINEVFPNPDPTEAMLPDAEYVELFNQSNKAIDLQDFQLADASSAKTLPAYILAPQSYLIICDQDDVALFSSFGEVLGVSSLFALNDSGDDVILTDPFGQVIHNMTYTTATYQDEDRSSGGYSLELINPTLYCQGASNYRASVANTGGTPGTQNSLFDDTPDLNAPQVLGVLAKAADEVIVTFDEPMTDAVTLSNGLSINGVGAIQNASLSEDGKTLVFNISTPFFQDQQNYTLNLSAPVADCSGNEIESIDFSFTYYEAQDGDRYDILINEFYPDFSPSLGLPEKEYVELYNRSDKTINLENYEFRNGNDVALLPFYLLLPGAYVTVYESGGRGFDIYGDTLVLDDFIGLANEIDEFGLYDPSGLLIHNVLYTVGWYQDAAKSDGGYSLELINPDAPCLFGSNWIASTAAIGGTPGQENSVLNLQVDDTPLELLSVFPSGDNGLSLTFNKAVDIDVAEDISLYTVDGLNGLIAIVPDILPNRVIIEFAESFVPDQVYEIVIDNAMTDCSGNEIVPDSRALFAIPQKIEAGDIIINEVLYDPETGGARFIELVNNSDKIFNIGDLNFATRGDDGQSIERISEVLINFLIFPGEYVVISPLPEDILQRYNVEFPERVFFGALPAYDSKEDEVLLFVPDVLGPRIIDELVYTDEFHNALLDDTEGVSLERITFNGPTNDPNNWQSAAATIGYATPTYLNSQFLEPTTSSANTFELPNRTFSPDGDGFEDVLIIDYASPQGGWVANIRIYDANGRLVKQLVNNESLASEGNFIWEGDNDEGTKARIGIYIVWTEVFKENGEVEQKKLTCVLAGQLD